VILILFSVVFTFGGVLEKVNEIKVAVPTKEEIERSIESKAIVVVPVIADEVEYEGRRYRIDKKTLDGRIYFLITDEEGDVVKGEDIVWIVLKGYFDVEKKSLDTWERMKENLERVNGAVKEALMVKGIEKGMVDFLEFLLVKKYKYLLSKYKVLLGEGDVSGIEEVVDVFSDFLECLLKMYVWREVGGEELLKEVEEHIDRLKKVSPSKEDLEKVFVFSSSFKKKLEAFVDLIYSIVPEFDVESRGKVKRYLEGVLGNLEEMGKHVVKRVIGKYGLATSMYDVLRYSLELFYLNGLERLER